VRPRQVRGARSHGRFLGYAISKHELLRGV
jgi:hypothetical protein